MNKLDKDYCNLLQDILENGVTKKDRTGTGTISVFGRQIRHKMSEGFPLLTTKKMAWKTMVTELLWFLRGDTNIKYLVDNNCHIWDGDAYKRFYTEASKIVDAYKEGDMIGAQPHIEEMFSSELTPLTKEEFIERIKTDDEFAKKWGELGPVYGKQWRSWVGESKSTKGSLSASTTFGYVDQIAILINDLKTNPDSRRLMVNSWNVGELNQMLLPPCHYGFQVYTRELSHDERFELYKKVCGRDLQPHISGINFKQFHFDEANIPTRAISLMWNQRSVDTPLGLPFNIASYGLLLELLAKMTNMVPDELIGNLGDCHIYSNQIDGCKEQIGRDYTLEERLNMVSEEIQKEFSCGIVNLPNFPNTPVWSDGGKMSCLDDFGIPRRTREPYPLPKLVHMKTDYFYKSLSEDLSLLTHLDNTDFTLENYQCHPTIKMPLSN